MLNPALASSTEDLESEKSFVGAAPRSWKRTRRSVCGCDAQRSTAPKQAFLHNHGDHTTEYGEYQWRKMRGTPHVVAGHDEKKGTLMRRAVQHFNGLIEVSTPIGSRPLNGSHFRRQERKLLSMHTA